MKVSAIAGCGAAKDFWDLGVLLDAGVASGDLAVLLSDYARKFDFEDVGHVIRSLAYFDEANAAPLRAGLSSDAWNAIKARFARSVTCAVSPGLGRPNNPSERQSEWLR